MPGPRRIEDLIKNEGTKLFTKTRVKSQIAKYIPLKAIQCSPNKKESYVYDVYINIPFLDQASPIYICFYMCWKWYVVYSWGEKNHKSTR